MALNRFHITVAAAGIVLSTHKSLGEAIRIAGGNPALSIIDSWTGERYEAAGEGNQ